MYMQIIVTACLASVVIMSVVLTGYASGLKKDFDNKMRNIVDQVNTSQFYQYELEKRSYDKMNTMDTNISNVRNSYIPKKDFNDRIVSNMLDVKDIKQHEGTVSVGGKVDFGNSMTIRGDNNSLNVTLPSGTNMNIRDGSGKKLASYGKDVGGAVTPYQKIDRLQIGDKWQLSGVGDSHNNDGWLRLFDKDGKNYYGGLATSKIMARDEAIFEGNTTMETANVSKSMSMRGGDSEHNPSGSQTEFPSNDNKNYIRGDTKLEGNFFNVGDLSIGRDLDVKGLTRANRVMSDNIKLGHNWGGWADEAPITAYTTGMGASFGNEYWSHFPKNESTYIRPGKTGGSIFIGDIGNTGSIEMGDKNTVTRLQGQLCLQDTCINKIDLDVIKKLSLKS